MASGGRGRGRRGHVGRSSKRAGGGLDGGRVVVEQVDGPAVVEPAGRAGEPQRRLPVAQPGAAQVREHGADHRPRLSVGAELEGGEHGPPVPLDGQRAAGRPPRRRERGAVTGGRAGAVGDLGRAPRAPLAHQLQPRLGAALRVPHARRRGDLGREQRLDDPLELRGAVPVAGDRLELSAGVRERVLQPRELGRDLVQRGVRPLSHQRGQLALDGGEVVPWFGPFGFDLVDVGFRHQSPQSVGPERSLAKAAGSARQAEHHGLGRLLPGMTSLVVAIALLGFAAVAPAHAQSGSQYHHFPNNAFNTECMPNHYNGWGQSRLNFNRPDDVRSVYASEWVYFRPIAARWTSNGWEYSFASWQRGLATPSGLRHVTATYGGASKWTSEDGSQTESLASLRLAAGVTHWLGYEIWSQTRDRYHAWMAQKAC